MIYFKNIKIIKANKNKMKSKTKKKKKCAWSEVVIRGCTCFVLGTRFISPVNCLIQCNQIWIVHHALHSLSVGSGSRDDPMVGSGGCKVDLMGNTH